MGFWEKHRAFRVISALIAGAIVLLTVGIVFLAVFFNKTSPVHNKASATCEVTSSITIVQVDDAFNGIADVNFLGSTPYAGKAKLSYVNYATYEEAANHANHVTLTFSPGTTETSCWFDNSEALSEAHVFLIEPSYKPYEGYFAGAITCIAGAGVLGVMGIVMGLKRRRSPNQEVDMRDLGLEDEDPFAAPLSSPPRNREPLSPEDQAKSDAIISKVNTAMTESDMRVALEEAVQFGKARSPVLVQGVQHFRKKFPEAWTPTLKSLFNQVLFPNKESRPRNAASV